jgi:hypothetical protein
MWADKWFVKSPVTAVALGRGYGDGNLETELLEALQRMVRRGHLPSSALVVRLTDGRVRLNYSVENREQARDGLRRICNEYGPARTALWVSVERQGTAVQLAVETLKPVIGGAAATVLRAESYLDWQPASECVSRCTSQTLAGAGSTGFPADFSASSRNRAMREASLGITTGWLPNVDSMLLPSGARSWPV